MVKSVHCVFESAEADVLKAAQMEAALCWNDILSMALTHYNETGKWLPLKELQKRTKRRYDLHSQTVQALCDEYDDCRRATREKRKNGDKRAKYPYKTKRFKTLEFKKDAIRQTETGVEVTVVPHKRYLLLPPCGRRVRTVQIKWERNHYVVLYTVEVEPEKPVETGKAAGVDLGEVNLPAVATEDGDALVVSGRHVRSLKRKRNKGLGKPSGLIGRTQSGSRRRRRLVQAKRKLQARTDNQVKDAYHQATAKAIRFCKERNVETVVVGDPKNVAGNTRKDKRLDRKNRQKVSQMEYGRMKALLAYKAELNGMRHMLVNERHTSQTCPVCGKRHKPCGREFRCPECGLAAHRDAIGAHNILCKEKKTVFIRNKPVFQHPVRLRKVSTASRSSAA